MPASSFSVQEFCDTYLQGSDDPWKDHAESSLRFLEALNLSSIPPHCLDDHDAAPFPDDVPPMGPLVGSDHHDSFWDAIVTLIYQVSPALLAMAELWLRLFASILAPLCITILSYDICTPLEGEKEWKGNKREPAVKHSRRRTFVSLACLLSVASSVVLTNDTLYVLHYGYEYGLSLLCASVFVAFLCCYRHRLVHVSYAVVFLMCMSLFLSYEPKSGTFLFGGEDLPKIQEGLYYDHSNRLIQQIAENWPVDLRIYNKDIATPWILTGDARTGLPFLLNKVDKPQWTRVWLPTVDDEVVALDFSFPATGHDSRKPLYLVLHGLNGGSEEEYCREMANRRTAEGSTVVVMVARGLMDLPVKGWDVFHGARIDDVHAAASALRPVLGKRQILAGVGFSMGAIVLNNYVSRSGKDCALDAAVTISGGLDCLPQLKYKRAQRLWQPMMAQMLREKFVIGKFGERYKKRLTRKQMLELMRATHITSIDEHAVVTYNSYRDLEHYYSEMSALNYNSLEESTRGVISPKSRIHNIAIPLCVIHALDDPIITWQTVADNRGDKHPENLVKTGSGNLMLLLTKAGGHVGWPMGWNPTEHDWEWMVDAAKGFVDSVVIANYKSRR